MCTTDNYDISSNSFILYPLYYFLFVVVDNCLYAYIRNKVFLEFCRYEYVQKQQLHQQQQISRHHCLFSCQWTKHGRKMKYRSVFLDLIFKVKFKLVMTYCLSRRGTVHRITMTSHHTPSTDDHISFDE